MINLREAIERDASREIDNKRCVIAKYQAIQEWARSLETYEISGLAYVNDYGEIIICAHGAGKARELAAELSADLGLQFEKGFRSKDGVQQFMAQINGGISIRVQGSPPPSCNLRLVSETQTINKWEIDCEDAAEQEVVAP